MTFASRRSHLIDMLRVRRPADSVSEKKWIKRYVDPLGSGMQVDRAGNRLLRIGSAPVLWSCHTDTVHDKAGDQRIVITGDLVSVAGASSCLGADDGVGVWLMANMIRRGIEGLYIFHRAEEIGGIGSNWIAERTPEVLDGITYAVALDRRGTHDVITAQAGGPCCSSAFAQSLCVALGMNHLPSDRGSFTDTANYTDLIGECTNVSVGYYNEHSRAETLDMAYAEELLDALCALDVATLEAERLPGAMDMEEPPYWQGTRPGDWDDDDIDFILPTGGWDLASLVEDYPALAADMLEQLGVDIDEFEERIRATYGARS